MENNILTNTKKLRTLAIICSVVMLALCLMKIMPHFRIYTPRLPLLLLPIWTLIFSIAGSKMNKKLILLFPALLIMEFIFTGLDNILMGSGFWTALTNAKSWMLWVLVYALTVYALGGKKPDGKPLMSAQMLTVLFIVWVLCGLQGISLVYKSFALAYKCLYALLMLPAILLATYPELAVSEGDIQELSENQEPSGSEAVAE